MNKNGPGTLITVTCKPDLAWVFAEVLLRETTSKALRRRFEYELRVPAWIVKISTRYGLIRCKVAKMGNANINATPEYENCKRIVFEQGVPLKDVMLKASRMHSATFSSYRSHSASPPGPSGFDGGLVS